MRFAGSGYIAIATPEIISPITVNFLRPNKSRQYPIKISEQTTPISETKPRLPAIFAVSDLVMLKTCSSRYVTKAVCKERRRETTNCTKKRDVMLIRVTPSLN